VEQIEQAAQSDIESVGGAVLGGVRGANWKNPVWPPSPLQALAAIQRAGADIRRRLDDVISCVLESATPSHLSQMPFDVRKASEVLEQLLNCAEALNRRADQLEEDDLVVRDRDEVTG
jgi:hypothetical protein